MDVRDFTLGEWANEERDGIGGRVNIISTEDKKVAAIYGRDADIALMVDSPKMVELLKCITDCYYVGSKPENFIRNVEEFMIEARSIVQRHIKRKP